VSFVRPDTHVDLFLAALKYQGEGVAVATICTVPISGWIIWEDESVDIEQLQRALSTWWSRAGKPTWTQSHDHALSVIRFFGGNSIPADEVPDFRNELAEVIHSKSYQRERLHERANEMLTAKLGRDLSDYERSLNRGLLDEMWSMVRAMEKVDERSLREDELFDAREVAKHRALQYCDDFQNVYERQPTIQAEFPTLKFFVNKSPFLLLNALGMAIAREIDGDPPLEFERLPRLIDVPLFRSLPLDI
jgi:hypothetical protein